MPRKLYHSVNTFNAGEVSELLHNREDVSKYRSACRVLENAMPLVEGGAKKMPGTYYCGTIKDQTEPCRLVPFQWSTGSGAILEFSETVIRIWVPSLIAPWTLILEGTIGTPVELTTPYTQAELFELDCSTQSVDVLWIFHPNHPPACVERFPPLTLGGVPVWVYTLSPPGGTVGEPPYRGTTDIIKAGFSSIGIPITDITKANPCVIKLAESVPSGTSRIYINGCSGMAELNNGEFYIIGTGSALTVIPADTGTIVTGSISGTTLTVTAITYGTVAVGMEVNGTSISAGTVVTALGTGTGGLGDYTVNNSQTAASQTIWSKLVDSTLYLDYTGGGFVVPVVALFGTTDNYPACGTFYQQRLWVGGTNTNPTKLYGSVQGDYPDFIADPNQDDYAVQFTLVSTKLDQIINMLGTSNALVVGTAGGIWTLTSPTGTSVSQTSVIAAKQTTLGVSKMQPQLVGDSAVFVSRSAKTVMFLVYNFVSNQWDNYDLTRLNRQITIGDGAANSSITQTAFQNEPYPVLWSVRSDGQLLGLVFNKQDQVYAWFRINMPNGLIESVAVISGENQEDMVAISVQRTINGSVVRYVETFAPQELFNQLSNAFFVHSGLSTDLTLGITGVITNITNGAACVVTVPSRVFTNGDRVQISGVLGMTEVNQGKDEAYTVANSNAGARTFELQGVDSSAWGTYTGGGIALPVTNTVSGLSHLLGEEVVAVGDGAIILPPTVVVADTITLPYYCAQITIGLPYTITVQPTNPIYTGPHEQTSRGLRQKLGRITISLWQSMGGQFGTDSSHMYDIVYGPGTKGQQPEMRTLEISRDMDADWDDKTTFIITQSDPLPFTLRGLVMNMSYNAD